MLRVGWVTFGEPGIPGQGPRRSPCRRKLPRGPLSRSYRSAKIRIDPRTERSANLKFRELDHSGLRRLDLPLREHVAPEDQPERPALGVDPVGHSRVAVRDHHLERAVRLEAGLFPVE